MYFEMDTAAPQSTPSPRDTDLMSVLTEKLDRHKNNYIVYKSIKIYCAIWNVERNHLNSALDQWLLASTEPPDIYAIGLQELSEVFNANRPQSLWITKLLESVNRHDEYEMLEYSRLVSMMLLIFVRKRVRPQISGCVAKRVYRGLRNAFAVCGGIAVSLKLHEDSLCFVNSHWHHNIERDIDFGGNRRHIGDHEHIFWLGDLNGSLSYQGYTVDDLLSTQTNLAARNQSGRACGGLVLWKGARIAPLACSARMQSDRTEHKPVYALFDAMVKAHDPCKYKMAVELVLQTVDHKINANIPRLHVDKSSIDFSAVHFNEQAMDYITVSNSCSMPVNFMLRVKEPSVNAVCEEWLHVEPTSGTLPPDSVKGIRVAVSIDERSVRSLLGKLRSSVGKFNLDIVVLHVEHGPDVFITVTGEYKPSCFGLSMETLCRSVQPIFDCTQADVKELMCSESEQFAHEIPQEFLMLYNYLKGKTIEGSLSNLHSKQYVPEQFNEIRDWLDCRSKKQFPGSPNAAAKALLMLLDLPAEPLLHPYVDELLHTNDITKSISIISKLPVPRKNIFWKLCLLLGAGIEGHYLEINDVADTFGSVLLRSCTPQGDSPNLGTLRRKFMYRFLQIDTDRKQSGCILV